MTNLSTTDTPKKRFEKIYVAGHRGMAGSALVRSLHSKGYNNIVTASHAELDLTNQAQALEFMKKHQPDYVFIAAAKVGGIHANNTLRADFIIQNLMIECNLIQSAHLVGVQNLCFLGSSCIYPRDCPQPIAEEYLLTGPLEPTNEPYAIAKIAGLKLCESYNRQYGRQYISVMPTNLYGPNDNYDLMNAHVLPALLRKTHEAKNSASSQLVVWGSGTPKREFLYIDDFSDACTFLMETNYSGSPINIGTGSDLSIQELAETIMEAVGFRGSISFDATKPDGVMRRVLNINRILELGWKPKFSLKDGLCRTYADFQRSYECVAS